MDKYINIIIMAKQTLDSPNIVLLPEDVCEFISQKTNKHCIGGKSIGVESDAYIRHSTQVFVAVFEDVYGEAMEELTILSDDTAVFRAKGHDLNDYKTTYINDTEPYFNEWYNDFYLLSLGA